VAALQVTDDDYRESSSEAGGLLAETAAATASAALARQHVAEAGSVVECKHPRVHRPVQQQQQLVWHVGVT